MAKGGRLQRRLEKYVFNPPNKFALRLGIAPRAFALLETTGRRSGEPCEPRLETVWTVLSFG